MDTKKLHCLVALISYPVTILHFIFGGYASELLISGISFFSVATLIYVGFVYFYFKSDLGKKIVMSGLLLIAIVFALIAIIET